MAARGHPARRSIGTPFTDRPLDPGSARLGHLRLAALERRCRRRAPVHIRGSLRSFGCYRTRPQHIAGARWALVPQGAYRFSPDLQRVGDVAVLLGYSLVYDSLLALVAMLFLSWWYLLARLAEAPWLREDLGSAFEVYVGRGPQSLADRGVRPNKALQRTA